MSTNAERRATAAPIESDTAATSFVHAGRQRVRVQTLGEGPPLLLLMGIGGNLEMWEPLRAMLPGRRLIAFDVPGTGESTVPILPMRMISIADVAAKVLDHVGCEQADVLGVSWGGVLAQTLAIAHPAKVRRLVLAATLTGLGSIPGKPSAMWILATPRRYYSRRYLERVAPKLYGGRIQREPGLFEQQALARLSRPPSLRGYAGQVFAISTVSTLPFLRCIKAPTLVLSGDGDPIVPTANSRVLARFIPDATLHIIPGGGHLFLLDSAEQVAPIITSFLDRPTLCAEAADDTDRIGAPR